MASCAVADPRTGAITLTATPVTKCTGVVLLSRGDYQTQQALSAPFDYSAAASIWSLAFGSVLALYLVSHTAGVLLQLIRRG